MSCVRDASDIHLMAGGSLRPQDGPDGARARGCRSAKQYDGHASHLGQGEERHPGVRVSVPYAFSTGVFLIYGYIAMLLS
jgi:hypothetical protein